MGFKYRASPEVEAKMEAVKRALIEQLAERVRASGMSIKACARLAGIWPSRLSDVLSGRYTRDASVDAVLRYLLELEHALTQQGTRHAQAPGSKTRGSGGEGDQG